LVANITTRTIAVQVFAFGGDTRVAEKLVRPPESSILRFVIVIAGASAASAQAPAIGGRRVTRSAPETAQSSIRGP
jgi:hypothetical protein